MRRAQQREDDIRTAERAMATQRQPEEVGRLAREIHGRLDYSYIPKDGPQPGVLPPDAARQLRQIERDAAEINLIANATHEEYRALREDRAVIFNQIDQLEQEFPNQIQDDRVYNGLKVQADAMREQVEELNGRYVELSGRWRDARTLAGGIADWLKASAGAIILPWSGPVPKLAKGEIVEEALNRCRGAIDDLRGERAAVESAPIPLAEAKARARRFVAALGERARPSIGAFLAPGTARPYFDDLPMVATNHVEFPAGARSYDGGYVHDGLALFALLAPDALTAALERQIEAEADDARAVPEAERDRRLADLAARLLAAEREEEALFRLAAQANPRAARRPNADPRAVLMVGLADPEEMP